jgi:hypothetical protein
MLQPRTLITPTNSFLSTNPPTTSSLNTGTNASLQQLNNPGSYQIALQDLNQLATDVRTAVQDRGLTSAQGRALYLHAVRLLQTSQNPQRALNLLQSDLTNLESSTTLSAQDLQAITGDINALVMTVAPNASWSRTSTGP